ncbi:hypothetical protein [Pseudomonas oryzihabitans]|uniref:hypothetical protein n=1 Tax=Pseudomonas oryzihabitans TaxID=47885 RepID=UPI00126A527A|nr:hypothetical protein [Pseudomonas oryzihabitans]
MALIQWWTSISSSEQAAWIQAVGSVAAICVAVAIPAITSLSQRRAKAADNAEKAKNVILYFYPSLLRMNRSLDRFIEQTDSSYSDDEGVINIDPDDGDFQKHIPDLLAAASSLAQFSPAVAGPLRTLLYRLIDMQHWLESIPAIQRSGSPGFYRNNLDDIREQAIDLKVLTGKALEACSTSLQEKSDPRGKRDGNL